MLDKSTTLNSHLLRALPTAPLSNGALESFWARKSSVRIVLRPMLDFRFGHRVQLRPFDRREALCFPDVSDRTSFLFGRDRHCALPVLPIEPISAE